LQQRLSITMIAPFGGAHEDARLGEIGAQGRELLAALTGELTGGDAAVVDDRGVSARVA